MSRPESRLSDVPTDRTAAALTSTLVADLSRRLFGRRLMIAIPAATAMLLAEAPQAAQAGVDGDWTLAGNSIAADGTQFLGVTNDVPLIFKTTPTGTTTPVERMRITSEGNIGIGSARPLARLTVQSAGAAVNAFSPSSISVYGSSSSNVGVFGLSSSSVGVRGQSTSGSGVVGSHSGATGTASGVSGDTASATDSATGVLGSASAATGITYGVRGVTSSANLSSAGVRGEASFGIGVWGKSPSNVAVRGQSTSSVGVQGTSSSSIGVQGNSSDGTGVYGASSSSFGVSGLSVTHVGVRGVSNSGVGVRGDSLSNVGVRGESTSSYGVFGVSPAVAIYGLSTVGVAVRGVSTSHVGVWGSSSTNTGVVGSSTSRIGVQGSSASSTGVAGTSGSGYGVRGESGSSIGVAGNCDAQGGTGVYGSSRYGFGVTGHSQGPGAGYAGWFLGNVQVYGSVSKSSGSFKIDHPLDPENKYLYHSFVESPDMKNIYDGVVTLDSKGEATVELPEWFEALNDSFRYQLTCIGGFAPVYIASEIANNRFGVAGGKPGMKVSWQVTGIRKDAYAQAYRIPIEEDKPEADRGSYLHPDVYGQPETKQQGYAKFQRLQSHAQAEPEPPAAPIP